MFEITIRRRFAASHTLRLPDGLFEPLHGHNWELAVTVGRDGLDAMETTMDFHELERIVDERIEPWINRHLNDVAPFADGTINPSAERVAEHVGRGVASRLPAPVQLLSVTVGEAPDCTATYRPAAGERFTPTT